MSRAAIIRAINKERERQNMKWGENAQDGLANGVGVARLRGLLAMLIQQPSAPSEIAKHSCDEAMKRGTVTFADILIEEVCEALEESNPISLKHELIQVAAVCVKWIEKLERVDFAIPDEGGELQDAPTLAQTFGPLVAVPKAKRCKSKSFGKQCVLAAGPHPGNNHRALGAIWVQERGE